MPRDLVGRTDGRADCTRRKERAVGRRKRDAPYTICRDEAIEDCAIIRAICSPEFVGESIVRDELVDPLLDQRPRPARELLIDDYRLIERILYEVAYISD